MDEAPVTPSEFSTAEAELRTAPRFALVLRAVKLLSPAGDCLCILRDVSETGVKVRLFHELPTETRFQIELGNGVRYAVEPVWQDDSHAGLRFTQGPADLRELVEEPSDFPRRQIRLRIDPPLPVMVIANSAAQTGEVRDISQSGGAVLLDVPLALRQPVQIEARGIGQIAGRVCWRRGKLHGIVFQEGFRLDQLAQLVARLNLARAARPGQTNVLSGNWPAGSGSAGNQPPR